MPAPTPFVTGQSVFGLKYKDGTVLAADRGLAYGKQHLTSDYQRVIKLTDKAALVFSGDEADMRNSLEQVKEYTKQCRYGDIPPPSAKAIHGLLSAQNYDMRNEQKPYLANFIVAGPDFLGCIDIYGTNFEQNFFATSLGRYYCMPLMRNHWKLDMTKEEATQLVKLCIDVMRRNDCLAEKKYDICFITQAGIEIQQQQLQETFTEAAYRDLPQFV